MAAAAPVWLFTGPEIGERNEAVQQLKAQAIKTHGDPEMHTVYAGDTPFGELVSLLQNGSLFSSARFVTLRNAELIKKKEDISQLVSWAEESCGRDDVYLVLISDEIGVDKKVEACVAKERKRIFWELFDDRKEQWITAFFRKEGYRIEPEAVSAILETVENNTDALRTACSRLMLFFDNDHGITEDDIITHVSHNREENAFTLFDALTHRDAEAALAIIEKISLSKDSSPVQVIAGVTYCFRRLADWHRLASRGVHDEFGLKKAGFSGKRALSQYRRAADVWDASAVSRVLALLAETDRDLRASGTAVHRILLDTGILGILKTAGTPPRSRRQ